MRRRRAPSNRVTKYRRMALGKRRCSEFVQLPNTESRVGNPRLMSNPKITKLTFISSIKFETLACFALSEYTTLKSAYIFIFLLCTTDTPAVAAEDSRQPRDDADHNPDHPRLRLLARPLTVVHHLDVERGYVEELMPYKFDTNSNDRLIMNKGERHAFRP
ncbi:hypothetical protein EVAR_12345_1 [Eumeta japonica]|uniref:Uncharacterized protein n=1 Tax=Eumeta variegata TaxID=151549 RepID=A0A4C1WYP1_EUMVA|nr:hypothetical protein EVAR_12345_1 [Eumeta japonica]